MKRPPPAQLGEVIGSYRLERVIGTGGMGCVYAAVHARLGRKAAVKVLSGALAADQTYVSRFFHEAKVVNDIQHPNIIDISDFIEQQDPLRVAYVMELLLGPSLGAALKARWLSFPQAINIALQLGDALEAVHNVGVVHRDLKPDNVIIIAPLSTDLSHRPSIKILDFGVAKSASPEVGHHTQPGALIGTPMYMAPEQVLGAGVSPATDVYAFGEILYEMLAGKRLFSGDVQSVLATKLREDRPEVKLPESAPGKEQLEGLIRACIAPKRADRPSLAVVAAILRDVLLLPGVQIAPIPAVVAPAEASAVRASGELDPLKTEPDHHFSALPSRRPGFLFGAGATLALAFAAIGVVYVTKRQAQTEPLSAQVEHVPAEHAARTPATSTITAVPGVLPLGAPAATSTASDRPKEALPSASPQAAKAPKSWAAPPARPRHEREVPKSKAEEETKASPKDRADDSAQQPKNVGDDARPLKKSEVPAW